MADGKPAPIVIYAALIGNVAVAATKFLAAAWTGSSAMLSEGVHSLVDSSNQILLLYGIKRAAKPADRLHPLGHGRELYFWSFIVSLLIFSLGAGISFYEGVIHIRNPDVIVDPHVNYIVLGIAAMFEGTSWAFAFREFEARRGDLSYLDAAVRSRDPTNFIVLFEDTAALAGIGIALIGTLLSVSLDMPAIDGVASLGIGVVLAATAVFLARESKGLLIGEPARASVRQSLQKIAEEQSGVTRAFNLFTVHMAPNQVLVAIELEFSNELSASQIANTVQVLEKRIGERHPEVIAVFVKPKGANGP